MRRGVVKRMSKWAVDRRTVPKWRRELQAEGLEDATHDHASIAHAMALFVQTRGRENLRLSFKDRRFLAHPE